MRQKPKHIEVVMKNLGAVDDALREIGELERRVAVRMVRMNEDIAKAKALAEEAVAPLLTRIIALETGMEAFAVQHRKEIFKKAKTKKLNFGEISFRQSTKVITKKNTLDLLIEGEHDGAIRKKLSIDKDELAKWSDEDLQEINARKKTEDVFGYKVNEEAIRDNKAA